MIVIIDGKEVAVQNDVRIIYDEVVYDMDENDNNLFGELHLFVNHEGIVSDLLDAEGNNIATMSQTYGEIADSCI